MRKLCLLYLCVFFFQGYLTAQNYQTVKTGTEFYFADTASGFIKAIKIASATINGTDSLLTNFFVARDTGDYCIWVTAPSWIGKDIIIRNNGFNIFFNSHNDSIFINTLADLNESWTLYTFPNGNYIEAEIISFDTATTISAIDSVKTISLQARDSGGNNISHSINGRQIKFSKNYGFVQLPEFYEFPENSTIDYKRINAHRLTFGEVYDFEVNDSFYYSYSYSDPNNPPDYEVLKVLNKNYSVNLDSVYYEIEYTFINNEVEWNPQPHMVATISVDTLNNNVTHLDSLIYHDIMPEESLADTFQGVLSYTMSIYSFCGEKIKESFDYGAYFMFNDFYQCFTSEQIFLEHFSYAENLGQVYIRFAHDGVGIITAKTLYGYIKGTDTCGTNFVTGIENIELSKGSVFPNPTNNIVNIRTENDDYYTVVLYNSLGQILFTDNFKGKLFELSLNQFSTGFYFLSLMNNKEYKQTYKLIKE